MQAYAIYVQNRGFLTSNLFNYTHSFAKAEKYQSLADAKVVLQSHLELDMPDETATTMQIVKEVFA